MEAVFECRFVPTVRKSANRIRKMSPVRTIFMLLLGIAVFLYIFPISLEYRFNGFWGLLAVLSVAYFLYGIFMPEICGYFYVRQFRRTCGTYEIAFGDNIEIRQGNIRVCWEYGEISRVVRLKHHYELQKDKRMGIMLDPNSFTKGTFEGFKKFLREKRPSLEIPE